MPDQFGNTERRAFLLSVGAIACSGIVPPVRAADPADEWIDAHVHIWTPDVQAYPISKDFQVSDMRPTSFTPEELFAHSQPCGVKRIVLIQMSFYQYDNRYMVDQIRKYPDVFSGIGIVDHRLESLESNMQELSKNGVRGLRLHPRPGEAQGWIDDAGMERLWKESARLGLAACTLINPEDIPHVESMAKRYSETRVVIDHFARIGINGMINEQSVERLCQLAKYPNVHVKTSAFYALGRKKAPYEDLGPMIRRLVDAFGPSRLMWGSDCPYQVEAGHDYEPSVALIRDRLSFLSDEDKQWLLRKTAEKLFF